MPRAPKARRLFPRKLFHPYLGRGMYENLEVFVTLGVTYRIPVSSEIWRAPEGMTLAGASHMARGMRPQMRVASSPVVQAIYDFLCTIDERKAAEALGGGFFRTSNFFEYLEHGRDIRAQGWAWGFLYEHPMFEGERFLVASKKLLSVPVSDSGIVRVGETPRATEEFWQRVYGHSDAMERFGGAFANLGDPVLDGTEWDPHRQRNIVRGSYVGPDGTRSFNNMNCTTRPDYGYMKVSAIML